MPVNLAKRIEIEDRQARVLELRLQHVTFDAIAEILGVTPMTVYRDYGSALAKHRDNTLRTAGEIKLQNKQRLESLIERQTRLLERDENPDPKAADRLMRAMDMLNKMYSVYVPDQGAQQGNNAGSGLTIRYEQTNVTIQRDSSVQGTQHNLAADAGSTAYIVGSAQHSTAALSDGDGTVMDDTAQDHSADTGDT